MGWPETTCTKFYAPRSRRSSAFVDRRSSAFRWGVSLDTINHLVFRKATWVGLKPHVLSLMPLGQDVVQPSSSVDGGGGAPFLIHSLTTCCVFVNNHVVFRFVLSLVPLGQEKAEVVSSSSSSSNSSYAAVVTTASVSVASSEVRNVMTQFQHLVTCVIRGEKSS